jgi:tetratricopeptide (TPR) repeat protein
VPGNDARDDALAPYSLKQVEELVGLSAASVRALVVRGFVNPVRGQRRSLRFTFQDLLLLKTAQGLRRAKVPPRRILDSLKALRAELPDNLPLTGLRITSAGMDVAVREAVGVREATTGQLLLDFEVTGGPSAVVVSDRLVAKGVERDWFSVGESLEETDVVKAEEAYRHALHDDPMHLGAVVNLGALLCDQGKCQEAVSLFEQTIATGSSNSLLHFNHAIALEDLARVPEAVEAYEHALAVDPDMADAHYNLALLLERQGDERGTLRHLNAYRRLSE